MMLISVVEGDFHRYKYVVYFFNLEEHRYQGYLALSDMLNLPNKAGLNIAAMDFELSADAKSLRVVADDQAYLITEKHQEWSLAT
jgi:hypothetical protein